VFIDRGSASGIEKGMAVVTPDGIVGKVIAVYPLAAQVLLVTDPTFSVGVESQKGHLRGTLNCKSGSDCTVDYVQNEEHVDPGETFYTSGEDRVFPKGFPVGIVSSAKPGSLMKEIHLTLSGAPAGAEEVLVVLEGVHQQIPDALVPTSGQTRLLPLPPADSKHEPQGVKLQTEADKIKQHYEEIGKEQNHQYGGIGSNLPNFNTTPARPPAGAANPGGQPVAQLVPGQTQAGAAKPETLGARPPSKATATVQASQPAATQAHQSGGPAGGATTAGRSPASNPQAVKPQPVKTPIVKSSGPPLPLGAPKPKHQPNQTTQPQNGQPPNE
jgi:rod shape-determining protein MreC